MLLTFTPCYLQVFTILSKIPSSSVFLCLSEQRGFRARASWWIIQCFNTVSSNCFHMSTNSWKASSHHRCPICSLRTTLFPWYLFFCHEFVVFTKHLFSSCVHIQVYATKIFINNNIWINIRNSYIHKLLCSTPNISLIYLRSITWNFSDFIWKLFPQIFSHLKSPSAFSGIRQRYVLQLAFSFLVKELLCYYLQHWFNNILSQSKRFPWIEIMMQQSI